MIINMLNSLAGIKKIPYFPEHVTLNRKHISDHDLDADFPINPTAYQMLKEVDGKKTSWRLPKLSKVCLMSGKRCRRKICTNC